MSSGPGLTEAPAAAARRRWPWLLAGGAIGGLLLAQLFSGGTSGPPYGLRTAPFMLNARDLAWDDGGTWVRTNPPVDLANVERLARASLGQIPVPADRDIATWQRSDTGEQVTQVVLLFDDPSAAARLDALAVRMLPGAFGLQPQPVDLPGASDARAWAAPGYHALSFRRDGAAVFVGSSSDDPVAARRLAAAVLRRLPTTTPTTNRPPTK